MPIKYSALSDKTRTAIGQRPMLVLDLDDSLWTSAICTAEESLLLGRQYTITFMPQAGDVLKEAIKAKNAGFVICIFTAGAWPMSLFSETLAATFSETERAALDNAIFINSCIVEKREQLTAKFKEQLKDGHGVKGSILKELFPFTAPALKHSILFDDYDEQLKNAQAEGFNVVDASKADCIPQLGQMITHYCSTRQTPAKFAPAQLLLASAALPRSSGAIRQREDTLPSANDGDTTVQQNASDTKAAATAATNSMRRQ